MACFTTWQANVDTMSTLWQLRLPYGELHLVKPDYLAEGIFAFPTSFNSAAAIFFS